ncbi:hypothetical protein G9F32_16225 [Acinetobacter sp. 194]|nr:hypothetical protein [Acinetobacter shaoyimingii]
MVMKILKQIKRMMQPKKVWIYFPFLLFSTITVAETLSIEKNLSSTQKWGLVQSGTACIEHYRFKPTTNEVFISSNQEIVTGTYHFIEAGNHFELPAIVISFETDNQKADCANNATNQAGTSTTNFLKRVSDKKIFFCNDSLGKQCSVYLVPEK